MMFVAPPLLPSHGPMPRWMRYAIDVLGASCIATMGGQMASTEHDWCAGGKLLDNFKQSGIALGSKGRYIPTDVIRAACELAKNPNHFECNGVKKSIPLLIDFEWNIDEEYKGADGKKQIKSTWYDQHNGAMFDLVNTCLSAGQPFTCYGIPRWQKSYESETDDAYEAYIFDIKARVAKFMSHLFWWMDPDLEVKKEPTIVDWMIEFARDINSEHFTGQQQVIKLGAMYTDGDWVNSDEYSRWLRMAKGAGFDVWLFAGDDPNPAKQAVIEKEMLRIVKLFGSTKTNLKY